MSNTAKTKIIQVRVTERMRSLLEEIGEREAKTVSELLREAVDDYLRKKEKE